MLDIEYRRSSIRSEIPYSSFNNVAAIFYSSSSEAKVVWVKNRVSCQHLCAFPVAIVTGHDDNPEARTQIVAIGGGAGERFWSRNRDEERSGNAGRVTRGSK